MTTITISVGTQLPAVTRQPDATQLFVYSAAAWNAHRIHVHREQAQAEGHRDLVVQGSLQGAWLADLAASWAGEFGQVRRVHFRNTGTAYVDEKLTVSGEVTAVRTLPDGRTEAELALQVTGPAGVTAQGGATVLLAVEEQQ
ncbi:acyl dehydratase [Streptomyces sp. NPDC050145]|uniref:acyl dehydratase n=1 Tax=Streptomyces sp. NPDC050145 TaxID=3365602 RepID=UPI0037890ADC